MSKELEDIKKQVGKPLSAKASLLQSADHNLRLAYEKIKSLEETMKLIVKKVMPLVSLEDSEDGICVDGRFAVYDSELYQSIDLTENEFNQIKEVIEKYGK